MMKFGVFFLAALAVTHVKNLKAEETIQVEVYYETLCPDSIRFITKQLYPTFLVLSNKIQLELIPFGKATETVIDGTRNFTCQHGPRECYGNKVHSCAIDLNKVQNSTEFVFCSESSDDPADDVNLEECAQTAGISWTNIQECMSSGKADDLLSKNGIKTNLIKPVFIPTIVLNGTFSQKNQDDSLVDFQTLICEFIECSAAPRILSGYTVWLISLGTAIFTLQLQLVF